MKRIMMVLPLAVMLAYCSGPNNTQTTEETDLNGTSNSVTASTTTTTDATASTTDVNDVNTNTTTVSSTSVDITTDNTSRDVSTIDMNDPMIQHFERVNKGSWTWDMNYPGYDRPVAGSYNAAVTGNWQLAMTPDLVSAWRQDNSQSLWSSGYAYNGAYLGGNTYLSASESFNTRSNSTLNSGLNNNASANSSVANQMNGNTTVNSGSTTDASVSSGSVLDVNSISYNAANGNMYQLPKFNLYLDNGSFTAYTGCNAISGRVEVSGTSLRFLNTTPSTNIDCLGGLDQNVLLDLLRRVDSYAYVNDELQLMQGSQVLLKLNKGSIGNSLH
jgi:heat shock protein HslJ